MSSKSFYLIFTILFLNSSNSLENTIINTDIKFPICKLNSISKCTFIVYKIQPNYGCFDYHLESQSSNVIKLNKINSINNNCYFAEISSNINFEPESYEYINVIEKNSNHKYRIKIGFGYIEKISIQKRFDIMNVGETLELHIIAKDKNENLFSTLEGLSFEWKLLEKNNIAQFVSQENLKLDNNNIKIKGLSTGKVHIITHLIGNGYDHIKSNEREILVQQKILLKPTEIWITPLTKFRFNIFSFYFHGDKEYTEIPKSDFINYKFYTSNESCGENKENLFFSGKNPCDLFFTCEDIRLKEINNSSAKIHIINPNELEMGYKLIDENEINKNKFDDIENFNFSEKWNLISGNYYVIRNYLKYNNNNIVYDEEKIRFEIFLNELTNKNYLSIIKSIKNGKYLIIYTLKSSNDYQEISSIQKDYSLNSKYYIKIYEKIKIAKFNEEKFLLPHLNNKSQELYLQISGGNGKYDITSSDENIIFVKENIIYSKNIGKSLITVRDAIDQDCLNEDHIEIEVINISNLYSNEIRQEVEVLSNNSINSIFAINDYGIFTNCTEVLIENINHDDKNILTNVLKYQDDYLSNEINEELLKLYDFIFLNKLKQYSKEYLQYSKYGLCSFINIVSKERQILAINSGNVFDSSIQIPFINKPQIQFYLKLIQIYPKIEDNLTLKLIQKYENILILNPNSSITVKLNEGILPWNDQHSKFQSEILIYKLVKNNEMEQIKPLFYSRYFTISIYNNKEINIQCWNHIEEDFQIEFKTFNSDSYIKNKKFTNLFINFSCQYSIYTSLILENDITNMSLQIPQQNQLKYKILINSNNNLRIYSFDKLFRPIISFINYELIKDNENRFEIQNSASFLYYYNINIKLNSFESTFPINYSRPSHSILIESINLPYISPKEKRILLNIENIISFKIYNGSGDFEITLSDSSLGEIIYNPEINKREFKLLPREVGFLKIFLIDKKFSTDNKYSCFASIKIFNIKKIQLLTPKYIQIGNTMKGLIHVFDEEDELFEEDQIKKMNLRLDFLNNEPEKNNSLLLNILEENQSHIYTSTLTIKGLNQGLQSILVYSHLPKNKIKSNINYIQIFNKIEVFPPDLLLIPGSEFTLKILGGPENEISSKISYEIEKEEIASIESSYPKVKAKNVGETNIIVKLHFINNENKLFSTKEEIEYFKNIENEILSQLRIPVQVAFPDRVDIENANNRKIYLNSSIRLLASFKLNEKSFSYGIGNIEYKWTLDNPHLGKLHAIDSIGTFMQAMKIGHVLIKLVVKINYPNNYINHLPNTFQSVKELNIEENVWVDINEFLNKDLTKSSIYLLPFNKIHELKTNKEEQNIKFSLLKDSDILSISNTGRIETFIQSGLVHILIEKTEKTGLIVPTVLNVYITDYYQIFAQNSNDILILESGQNIDLKISLQHESGLLFAERYEDFDLTIIESHPKVAKGEIYSKYSRIKIYAFNPGETNIIIYSKNSRKILDVFRIIVENSFSLPTEFNLSINSTVELFKYDKNKLEFIEKSDAIWKFSNPSIAEINKNIITAYKEGKTILSLVSNEGNKVLLKTEINVYSLSSLKIELGNVPYFFTSNKLNSLFKKEYILPFLFQISTNKYISSSKDIQFSSHLITHTFNNKCELTEENSSDFNQIISISSNSESCILIFSEEYNDSLKFYLKLSSKSDTPVGVFYKNSILELNFHSGQIINLDRIELYDSKKEIETEISLPHRNNNILITSPIENFITYKIENGILFLSLHDDIKDNLSVTLKIHDKTIDYIQEVSLTFTVYNGFFSKISFYDIIILILILITILILFLYYIGGQQVSHKKMYIYKSNSTGYGRKGHLNMDKKFE